jgi:hypothetical protein
MERNRPSNKLLLTTKETLNPTLTTKESTPLAKLRTSFPTPVSQPTRPRTGSTPQRQFTPNRSASLQPGSVPLIRSTPGRGSRTPGTDRFQCYRCGEFGHFRGECPNQLSPATVDKDSSEDIDDKDSEATKEEPDVV